MQVGVYPSNLSLNWSRKTLWRSHSDEIQSLMFEKDVRVNQNNDLW